MKKLITDNMWILVLVALVASGWAAYKIWKNQKDAAAVVTE